MAIAVAATTARRRAAPAAPTAPTTEELLRCAHTGCCGRTGSYSELPRGQGCISQHTPSPSTAPSAAPCYSGARWELPPSLSLCHTRVQGKQTQLGDPHPGHLLPHASPKFSIWQQVLPPAPALPTDPQRPARAVPARYPWECLTATTSRGTDSYSELRNS